MPRIRHARAADVPALAELLGELFSQEHEFTPDRTVQSRGLTLLLDLGDAVRILVAERQGRPIAMAVVHYSVSTALGRRVAMLEDVIVTCTERGKGIGKLLMAAVVETARTDGAARITLLTDHDNRAAQTFYEGFGFSRSTMVPYRRMVSRSLTV